MSLMSPTKRTREEDPELLLSPSKKRKLHVQKKDVFKNFTFRFFGRLSNATVLKSRINEFGGSIHYGKDFSRVTHVIVGEKHANSGNLRKQQKRYNFTVWSSTELEENMCYPEKILLPFALCNEDERTEDGRLLYRNPITHALLTENEVQCMYAKIKSVYRQTSMDKDPDNVQLIWLLFYNFKLSDFVNWSLVRRKKGVQVYRAIKIDGDQRTPVIIKVAINDRYDSGIFVPVEVEVLESLQHLNLVKMINWFMFEEKGFDDPRYVLVMEELQPIKLSRLEAMGKTMGNKRHTEFTAQILRDILCGLRFMHTNHHLHGDVKTTNVALRVEPGNRPVGVLLDFDLSVVLKPGETSHIHAYGIGTTGYFAPEVEKPTLPNKKSVYSIKSDMYSLGIMACEWMFLQEFNKENERSKEAILKYMETLEEDDKYQQQEQWYPLFKELVLKMIADQPLLRPSAEEALKHPFFATLTDPE